MRAWRRHRGRSWVALVAAYVLVVQALLGAVASGASAAPLSLDAFGHVICTSQGAERLPGGSGPGQTHHLPDCCLVGCSLLAPAALPAQGTAAIRLPARPASAVFIADDGDHRVPDRGGSPANPRAPPANA